MTPDTATASTSPSDEPASLARASASAGCGIGEVAAGHREQPVAHRERVERGEVLARLPAPPLVGGHDEQHGRGRPDPGEHVGDEPLVTRHVDERDLRHGGPVGTVVHA